MNLIPKEIIYKCNDRMSNYFSIIKYHNTLLYISNHARNRSAECVFNGHSHLILENTNASHNFSPFLAEGKVFAVGGLLYEENNRKRQFLHSDGMYLFFSKDGFGWETVYPYPIITDKTKGYNSCIDWKGSEFDTHPCVIHDDKYIMMLRDNVCSGTRYLQVGFSDNLLDWEFQPIKTNPELEINVDNYYHAMITRYKNYYLGFFPYYTKDFASIRLMKSSDCISWDFLEDLFQDKPAVRQDKNVIKNECHVCNGIYVKNDIIEFYVHHNYKGYDESRQVYVQKYELQGL